MQIKLFVSKKFKNEGGWLVTLKGNNDWRQKYKENHCLTKWFLYIVTECRGSIMTNELFVFKPEYPAVVVVEGGLIVKFSSRKF